MSRTMFYLCAALFIFVVLLVNPSTEAASVSADVLVCLMVASGTTFILSFVVRFSDNIVLSGIVGALSAFVMLSANQSDSDRIYSVMIMTASAMMVRAGICTYTKKFYILPKNRLTAAKNLNM